MFRPWQPRYPRRIRTVDAPPVEGGGAQPPDPEANENSEQVDWEAKYHDAVNTSHEWETKAKTSGEAVGKLTERAETAEKALADMKTAQQRLDWRNTAAKATGIPADLIRGDSEEEINAHAEALKSYLSTIGRPTAPTVPNPSGTPKTKSRNDNPNTLLLKQLFGTN
ncbi:hypothetical protein [Bifidobacterium oedipodis]|uniref:Helicase n=1 Tax=Bifidobacterium oedipodis TaxID=2675322 RepID=A0A7Y0HR02_9BIFI|nr:hypothetical protein [Bifidobacterium sp. DSM 109957]NMM93480.1 helicase [Bifidobacterium sp. DSM 109957]